MDCAVAFDARSELELMTLCNAALQDEHRDAPQLERARCSLLWGHGKQIAAVSPEPVCTCKYASIYCLGGGTSWPRVMYLWCVRVLGMAPVLVRSQ